MYEEITGKLSKYGLHDMAIHGPEKGPKLGLVFTLPLGFADDFGPRS